MSEEAAFEPLYEGGSNLAWLVAHLVASRDAILESLGRPTVRDADVDKRYDYGFKAPKLGEEEPFSAHVADYETAHARVLEALEALTPEQLEEQSGKSTLREKLEFRLWHETYHLGQAMLYRRAAGLESPIG